MSGANAWPGIRTTSRPRRPCTLGGRWPKMMLGGSEVHTSTLEVPVRGVQRAHSTVVGGARSGKLGRVFAHQLVLAVEPSVLPNADHRQRGRLTPRCRFASG